MKDEQEIIFRLFARCSADVPVCLCLQEGVWASKRTPGHWLVCDG